MSEIKNMNEIKNQLRSIRLKLLSLSSSKAIKSHKFGVANAVLYLVPAEEIKPLLARYDHATIAQDIERQYGVEIDLGELEQLAMTRINLCGAHGPAHCVSTCLFGSGRVRLQLQSEAKGKRSSVDYVYGRLKKTVLYLLAPKAFYSIVQDDIGRIQRGLDKRGLEMPLYVRLNGTSDILFERDQLAVRLFARNPNVMFFDYTKIPGRRIEHIKNYYLSFSYSPAGEFQKLVQKELRINPGRNLVVVFEGSLPDRFLGREVINGDDHDIRPLDKPGVVVGLTVKATGADGTKSNDAFFVSRETVIALRDGFTHSPLSLVA